MSVSVPTDLPFSIPMQVDVVPDIGSPATVAGENVGLTVAAWVADSMVRTGVVHGADDIATNPGEAAVGASAIGASVVGDAVTPEQPAVDGTTTESQTVSEPEPESVVAPATEVGATRDQEIPDRERTRG